MIQIKADIKQLKVVADKLATHWPDHALTIICTLLQNIGFGGPDSIASNYSYDEDVKQMFTAKDAINALADYHIDHPTISFIREEVENIFTAASHIYEDEDMYMDEREYALKGDE